MGAVSLFRNLEPSGLLLANVWALPVLIVGGHEKLPSDGHESARWRS